jgi:dTDP-4-amino-4,6-dideoxygalactose transaminase
MADESRPAPASESAPRAFTQTAESPFPQLDDWSQMTEAEANLSYAMTRRNELSGGTRTVREFEDRWRRETGLTYAITTFNGSSALLSAYFGLGVGPGDEVICPTYTWICSIGPALLLGARPVFAESDPKTMLLDPADVRRRITPRTRAIVAVHLWGNVCDLDALMAISRETGVPVIEDCSHAHGASYRGKPIGTIGQVGAWSLQGSKAVSAGEGGVLATNDVDVFERACIVGQCNRVVGLDLVTAKYAELQPLGLGMKLRSHPIGIGIAGIQLDKLAELNAKRGAYVEEVEAGLEKIPGVEPVKVVDGAQRGGYYAFPVHHAPEEHGDVPTAEFIEAIRAQGVPARPSGYGMLHDLPLFARGFDVFTRNRGPLGADYPGYRHGDFPVTEKMHERLVFLPVLSNPAPGAAEFVLTALRKAVDQVCRPALV